MPAGTIQARCSVCLTNARQGRTGDQCWYGCFVIRPGWLAWDAKRKLIRVLRAEATPLLRRYHSYEELMAAR